MGGKHGGQIQGLWWAEVEGWGFCQLQKGLRGTRLWNQAEILGNQLDGLFTSHDCGDIFTCNLANSYCGHNRSTITLRVGPRLECFSC
jgi:hypothetical protein